ncbi:keratin-associated protein 11-1 [Pteronotus mesoamericanus]|uniref:keratin-associated protein 11-1 n=1 Tax=Pteronotus mesoamericanus TaxID=1884717 RepID=UPI0023EA81BE|nr:keratin-associated protein 11-1 [Pteronotus parnellii mesoamericanus]
MPYSYSARNCAARPAPAPAAPAAPGTTHEVDCLSSLCLPSSFQTGSWLLDHCGREASCEPPACQLTSHVSGPGQVPCPRQAPCVSSPCSAPCSRPLTFVSSSCKAQGGASAASPPACGVPRTCKRPCVSGCRKTC